MEAKAYLKYARISPRKVQIVLDLIRGKDAAVAMGILKNKPRAASELLVNSLYNPYICKWNYAYSLNFITNNTKLSFLL